MELGDLIALVFQYVGQYAVWIALAGVTGTLAFVVGRLIRALR